MSGNARLGSVSLGEGFPVRIMAAINISPESFYKGSIATTPREISARVTRAVEQGAEIIDLGAMSTAPYLKNEIPSGTEASRVLAALRAVVGTEITISVDTLHASVAEAALKGGAAVINDVSGLKADPMMARIIRDYGASLLAMAHSPRGSRSSPIVQVRHALKETLLIAERAGIDEKKVVLDPGIGFFRGEGAGKAYSPQKLMPWYEWDCRILADLRKLESMRRPLCVGLSRKSFLGKIAGVNDPEERLPASLAATAIAVMNGASMIRTHDISETVQAVRVAEVILRRGPREDPVS